MPQNGTAHCETMAGRRRSAVLVYRTMGPMSVRQRVWQYVCRLANGRQQGRPEPLSAARNQFTTNREEIQACKAP
jgi:hypothetical protein